jgi:small subunit ribosomal protein S6
MRPYELVVVLHPDLEIDPGAPIEKIEKLVEAGKGKVIKRDNWGKKRLAYRINKQDYGVYVLFELSLDPAQTRNLENQILLTEEVMRHIMVTKEVNKPVDDKKKAKKAEKAEAKKVAAVSEEK